MSDAHEGGEIHDTSIRSIFFQFLFSLLSLVSFPSLSLALSLCYIHLSVVVLGARRASRTYCFNSLFEGVGRWTRLTLDTLACGSRIILE